MTDIIQRAAEFAQAAHEGIGQRRKYTNEPYIVHPRAVAQIVSSVTDDEQMIAAAWLHDVVEDTPVTIEEIEAEFGLNIARLVSDLTDVAQSADGNRRQRVAMNREHTARAEPSAKTIKLADVIDNLSDIVNQNADFAPKYLREKEELLEVLSDGHSVLLKRAQAVIREQRQSLDGLHSKRTDSSPNTEN